jgi:outer membrane cobalamin receptor
MNYNYALSDSLTLTPTFKYKNQTPYKESLNSSFPTPNAFYDTTVEEYTGSMVLTYDKKGMGNIVAGVENVEDQAKDNVISSNGLYPNGLDHISYDNSAAFMQGILNTSLANITLGARYDDPQAYKSSFVPRFGLTKAFERFHFKLLYSGAFRVPGIETIRLNYNNGAPPIEPEKSETAECEVGYIVSPRLFLVGNVFDTTIENPIMYYVDPQTGVENFLNYNKVRNRGAELECRYKFDSGYANINYSYYTVVENNVPLYAVPGNSDVLLGFPANKVTLNASMKLWRTLNFNPSLIYLSERYGYTAADANGNSILAKFDPVYTLNLYFIRPNTFAPGVDFGFGVYNLLNSDYNFIQPYDGGHGPIPGMSREYVTKVSYHY